MRFSERFFGQVDDPRWHRDVTIQQCNAIWAEADRLLSMGSISPQLCEDAKRGAIAWYIDEIVNDPVAFRRAMKPDPSGEGPNLLDELREAAAGYNTNPDESPDAAAQRRQDALEIVMRARADQRSSM